MDYLLFACSNAIFCFLGAYIYHLGARKKNPLLGKEPEESRVVALDREEVAEAEAHMLNERKRERDQLRVSGNGEEE